MIAKLIEYMSQLPICADLLDSRLTISHQLFNEKSPQIAVNQIDIYQVKITFGKVGEFVIFEKQIESINAKNLQE